MKLLKQRFFSFTEFVLKFPQKFPVRFGIGACITDNGPAIPIVYDTGNMDFNKNLYGPNSRSMAIPPEPVFFKYF